jgi:hypothetical protein
MSRFNLRYTTRPNPERGGEVERAYRIGHDKNGDPYRIYRQVHVERPGRNFMARQQAKLRKAAREHQAAAAE